MAFARLEHQGGAVATTLSAGIASGDSSLTLVASTNWPTGSVGPFYLVIDPGTSAEEKILATARSSLSLTGLTRGVDGTSAAAHSAGAVIQHIFTATEADEANNAVKATLGTVTTKGDLTPATGAGALARLAAGADGLPLVAASGQTTGLNYAALAAAGLASNAVTTAKILDANVTTAKILDGNVTLAKFATGLRPTFTVADSTALAALTPTAGDVAYQVDAKHSFAYNGSAWVPVGTITQQTAVTGATTSGATELTLATLSIAALPCSYSLEVSAYWSANFATGSDLFAFRIKVGGTQKAMQEARPGGTNNRVPFSLPTSTFTTIAVNTSASVTVTVQRISGSDVVTEDTAGLVTARLYPV